mgnify:CR=1 FL=1
MFKQNVKIVLVDYLLQGHRKYYLIRTGHSQLCMVNDISWLTVN